MIIHVLLRGVPLCGFDRHNPVNWPEGHRWVSYDDMGRRPPLAAGERFCGACAISHSRREERYEPPFDPSDCGGAFDGANVSSDADPGL